MDCRAERGEDMHLRIVHSTTFEYDGLAAASYNQARLTPATSVDQIVARR